MNASASSGDRSPTSHEHISFVSGSKAVHVQASPMPGSPRRSSGTVLAFTKPISYAGLILDEP
jgi:hypothetical protein